MNWWFVLQAAIPVATLALFAVAMPYFRQSSERSAAKAWLVYSAWICGAIQVATIVLRSSAGEALRCAGIAVDGGAIALFCWSLAAHGSNRPAFAFVNVKPSALTRAGPYRFVRHPIYGAYLLGWVAGALVSGRGWLLLTAAWMGTFYYVAARQEERAFAKSDLAEQYGKYRDETAMFFPTPRGIFALCMPRRGVQTLSEAGASSCKDEERS